MDRQFLWDDLMDTQNLPGSSVFAADASMPFVDLTSDESADLSIWSTGEASSSRHQLNEGIPEEVKREHGWTSPLTINRSQVTSTEEMQLEPTNMNLGPRSDEDRMQNVDLNLNSNQVDSLQSFSLNSGFHQNPDLNAGQVSRHSQLLGHFPFPSVPSSSDSVDMPPSALSANITGSSSRGAGLLTQRSEGRPGNSLDGRRLICKRKSVEGVSAQCSSDGNSSCLYRGENTANTTLSIASSSNYPSAPSAFGEQMNGRIVTAEDSDHFINYSTLRAESSQRNCRSRINYAQHPTSSSLQTPGNNLSSSDLWSTHQASNLFAFNQSLESRVVVAASTPEGHPPVLPVPSLAQNVNSFPVTVAPSSSRTSTSSRSQAIAAQRLTASRQETSARSSQRTNVLEHSPFIPPPPDIRHLMQHSTNWSLAPTASQSGSSSNVVQSPSLSWMPYQNAPALTQQVLPEAGRRSSVPSSGSGSGSQRVNVPSQLSAASSNSVQAMRSQRAAILRGLQQSYAMPTNGVVGGVPLALRSAIRDGSRRALSEHIRNAIQLAWRGERMQLEDAIFDHAVYFGVPPDLHDRHRDMRLDVDNMSYEELLALEERIGNVNTGLGEETVLKRLKQRKYISLTEETPSEVEPCCVCQEQYVEEEDIGRLDCGHDFHTACIKQWLMLKNLCPICKTTGLVT